MSALDALAGSLIVSCQAPEGSPLRAPETMAAMARAAHLGGARGIRANGREDIEAIRAAVPLPVVGLLKRAVAGSPVYITPERADAEAIAAAGADVIAVDATLRGRPGGEGPEAFVRSLASLGPPVMADVDRVEAGIAAAAAGAALVSTTLSGYTSVGPVPEGPDLELVAALSARLTVPVVAEGRYATPQDVRAAFAAGAWAVVVGTAITDPVALTGRFASVTPAGAGRAGGTGQPGETGRAGG